MVEIKIDKATMAKLQQAIEGTRKKLPREMANAVNKAAARTRTHVSSKIREELAITAKDVKRFLKIRDRATPQRPISTVVVDYEKRPGVGGPTKRFKPVQKAKGTSWKISKRARKAVVPGTFMGPRPGKLAPKLYGGVFKRSGPRRLPIVKIHGVSPWAVYMKGNMDPIIRRRSQLELKRQVLLRVRTLLRQKLGIAK